MRSESGPGSDLGLDFRGLRETSSGSSDSESLEDDRWLYRQGSLALTSVCVSARPQHHSRSSSSERLFAHAYGPWQPFWGFLFFGFQQQPSFAQEPYFAGLFGVLSIRGKAPPEWKEWFAAHKAARKNSRRTARTQASERQGQT